MAPVSRLPISAKTKTTAAQRNSCTAGMGRFLERAREQLVSDTSSTVAVRPPGLKVNHDVDAFALLDRAGPVPSCHGGLNLACKPAVSGPSLAADYTRSPHGQGRQFENVLHGPPNFCG